MGGPRGGVGRKRRRPGETHSDLNAVVGEDEGRVGRSELGGRHCEGFGVLENSWDGVW